MVCLMIMRKAKRGAQSSIISYIILFGLLALTFLYIFPFEIIVVTKFRIF